MPKIRVLIVDDAVVFRRALTDELARDPALEVVGTAANGRIALAKMTQVNPDVVVLDVEMPEMDGLVTLKELRKTYPRLPVIMFSALTERGSAVATRARRSSALLRLRLSTSLQRPEFCLAPLPPTCACLPSESRPAVPTRCSISFKGCREIFRFRFSSCSTCLLCSPGFWPNA